MSHTKTRRDPELKVKSSANRTHELISTYLHPLF